MRRRLVAMLTVAAVTASACSETERRVPDDYGTHAAQFDAVRLPEAWAFLAGKWQREHVGGGDPWPPVAMIDDGFFDVQTTDLGSDLEAGVGFDRTGATLPTGSAGNVQVHSDPTIRCRGYHGTATALVLGAVTNNAGDPDATLVVGVDPPATWRNVAGTAGEWQDGSVRTGGVKLVPIRVSGGGLGCVSQQSLAAALSHAAGAAEVVNVSLQLTPDRDFERPPLSDVVTALETLAAGASVVVAAGNDAAEVDSRGWLATPPLDSVIIVGGLNADATDLLVGGHGAGTRTRDAVDIYAPGADYEVQPRFIDPQDDTIPTVTSGTSLAAPLVSGTVAMMYNVNPCMTPAEHKSVLIDTARAVRLANRDVRILDAYAAVKTAWEEGSANGRFPCAQRPPAAADGNRGPLAATDSTPPSIVVCIDLGTSRDLCDGGRVTEADGPLTVTAPFGQPDIGVVVTARDDEGLRRLTANVGFSRTCGTPGSNIATTSTGTGGPLESRETGSPAPGDAVSLVSIVADTIDVVRCPAGESTLGLSYEVVASAENFHGGTVLAPDVDIVLDLAP